MNQKKYGNKLVAFTLATLFVVTGTYNALVISSDSEMTENSFVKRLDEMNGVVVKGRTLASKWEKLTPVQNKEVSKASSVKVVESSSKISASEEVIPAAAVEEDLTLSLVEVMNSEKWKQGISQDQFSGMLITSKGIIEELNVSLPQGEGLSVAFSGLSGNVFEYEMGGEIFTGMMYQVDQHSYMVTLTNGPLEGTKLRFSSKNQELQLEENQQFLADKNVDIGSFGSEQHYELQSSTAFEASENNSDVQSFKL